MMPHTQPPHVQWRRKVLLALVYFGLGVLVIGIVLVIITTLSLVSAIREQQKTNVSTNHTILDCTSPAGECFRQGQKRTAQAVDNIGRLSVYASACAADVDPSLSVRQRTRLIEVCVRDLVADPPASPGVP